MKKYKLAEEPILIEERKLYRNKVFRLFSDVKEGDMGRFIERGDNLSYNENC